MEGSSERSKIPIPLRLPVQPKPQSVDERLDQIDFALSGLSEGLKEIQKRLAEGHPGGPPGEEMSQTSIENPRVEPQPRINPRFDVLVRNPKYFAEFSVGRHRLLNQSLPMSAYEVGRLTKLANQLLPRMEVSHYRGDPPLTVRILFSQFARV
jgi:hypothetical protein